MEAWKSVVGFEGWYEVSDLGRVRRIRRGNGTSVGKVLKPKNAGWGYHYVSLCMNGIRHDIKIHRLVATAFVPNPNNKPDVNHKNGIKTCNEVFNLEWVTCKENTNHAFRTGLRRAIGEGNPNSKLTAEDVKQIRELRSTETLQTIADRFGVTDVLVSKIVHRTLWAHV